jgi:rubrerythrin
MCKKKLSKIDAMLALVNAQRIRKLYSNIYKRHELRYYLCPKCGYYHLTSKK